MCVQSSEWSRFIRETHKALVHIVKAGSLDTSGVLPTQADYDTLIRGLGEDLKTLTSKYAAGQISANDWAVGLDQLMLDAHTNSWKMGRNLAGNFADETELDTLMGIAAKDVDGDRLLDFLRAIEDGDPRYFLEDGTVNPQGILNRANMYLDRSRGTLNEAFIEKSEGGSLFTWTLGGVEEHCPDCPEIAAMGALPKDELITTPGSCMTPCLTNCKCYLVRQDGVKGFELAGLDNGSDVAA